MHFGATLRLLRAAVGVSLSSLATDIGVSPAYLSRVEHGRDPPPTPDRLRAIALSLHMPPERLLDLVEELRPEASDWLAGTPEGRHLAAEIRRRNLSPAQIARIIQFIQTEFSRPSDRGALPLPLDPRRVLLGVRARSLRDALDIAALRLAEGPEAVVVARALRAQERACSGAVGGGLLLAHASGPHPEVRACLISLVEPLHLPTPDELPIRALLAFIGPRDAITEHLIEAAHFADPGFLQALSQSPTPEAALLHLEGWRSQGLR